MSGFGTGGTRHVGNSSPVQYQQNQGRPSLRANTPEEGNQRTTGRPIRPRHRDDGLIVKLQTSVIVIAALKKIQTE